MPKVRQKQRYRALMTAVAKGSLSETKRLLCLGKHPDSEKNIVSGQTPAFLAASRGHNDIFELLLSKRADIGLKDIHGNSVLHVTTNINTIEILVGAGIDVNGKNKLGRTPLHCAIIRGDYEAAESIIKNGGDVNVKDCDGNTCLHHVSKTYHDLSMHILQNTRGDFDITDAYDSNRLVPFLKRNHTGGFHRAILEHEQDLFEHICRVTSYAKSREKGIDAILNDLDRASNRVHMTEVLIGHGADPNIPNSLGQLPLHLAVDGSNKDLITLLCKSSPSAVDTQDNIGRTPAVHCYSFLDHYDHEQQSEEKRKEMVLHILYKHGADLNITDFDGIGLLCYATDSLDCLKFVLNLGADSDIRTCTGSSILHIIAGAGGEPDEEMVELLLQNGLNINCRDQFGATPLFFATWAGDIEWINLLVKHGCRIDALDHAGRTAADLADFNKRDDIGDILREMTTEQSDRVQTAGVPSDGAEQDNVNPQQAESESVEGVPSAGVQQDNMNPQQAESESVEGVPSDGAEQDNVNPQQDESESVEGHSQSEITPPTKVVLAIENSSQVETMFKSVTLPVDGTRYIADLLESPVTGRTYMDEESREIQKAVLHLTCRISDQFEKFDPRFKMRMELSGSVNEGTKCGRANEFDFLCCLENFENKFQPKEGESDPPGFVGIVCSENSDNYKEWQKKDGSLINSKVVETFYRILYKSLHSAEVWETSKAMFPSLNYVPELLISGPSVALSLCWTGAKYKNMEISIDMVPAIYFKKWWPHGANDHLKGLGSLRTDGCHVVLTTFQDMDSWNGDTPFGMRIPHYFRISFSQTEAKFFQSVSQHVRDGFILAKTLREQCQPTMSVYSLIRESESQKSAAGYSNHHFGGSHSTGMSSSIADQVEDEDVLSKLTESEESMSDTSSITSVDESTVVHADIIDTYMLKMSLLHEFDILCSVDDIGTAGEVNQVCDTRKAFEWVKKIYNRLAIFIDQGAIPSFFVPGFNLLNRKDTKDFYVFDDKFTEEELDAGNAAEDSTITYNPLPENHKPKDGLPNDIDGLKSLLAKASESQKSFIWSKLRRLCDIENFRIYISIIERILRECKENMSNVSDNH